MFTSYWTLLILPIGVGSFQGDFEHQGSFDLLTLVDNLRENSGTDPRDKVYALLNVAMDEPNIKVDYRLSPSEVYATAAKWSVTRHENLSVLSLVEKEDMPDLTSWVPDLRGRDYLNFMH